MPETIRPSDLLRNAWLALKNVLRRLNRRRMDYVVLRVHGPFPERTQRTRRRFPLSLLPWAAPPPSVETINATLERLAGDPRVKGAVLIISGLQARLATVTSLRQAVLRLRESGKTAIAYLHGTDLWSYYLACACDQVLAPESAGFKATGLWTETLFLKDTLALAGIEADFEAIAEYKVSPDTFRRSTMTEPHREMLEAILDSAYAEIVGAMARGRRLEPDHIQELMDSAPLTAGQALEAGLLDAVCYEDELPAQLGGAGAAAVLLTLEQAQKRLLFPLRWHSRQAIGVISLEGTIVTGPSRRSPVPLPIPLPLPGSQAGSDTLVQQLRAAARNKHLAGVVLHVDSPGGSALASDLIWREVAHLGGTKPVVVYMSNVAASGGYYVASPAAAILAQATTLTGSIGIWSGKFVTRGLLNKIQAGREVVSRGKAAGLYADAAPFSDEERSRIRADIGDGYTRFKARVAEGRGMDDAEVEAVARGRVWTGEQALARGLVDGLGDLHAAAAKARELAQLDPRRHAPVVNVPVPKRRQLPTASRQDAGEWPANPQQDAGEWLANLAGLLREGIFALAPWAIRIRS